MSYLVAEHDSVLISNVLARMGTPEYLILGGLNDAQKSYLALPGQSQIIEIAEIAEIKMKLSGMTQSRGELRCRTSDVLSGLFAAQKLRKSLVIDEEARLPEVVSLGRGIIVVEDVPDDASPVIAVNYANSIGASLLVVEALPQDEPLHTYHVQEWIQQWKENADDASLEELRSAVLNRVDHTFLGKFDFATFFTEGLPYSLMLENIVPCSHVHLSLRPDLFIMHNVLLRDGDGFGSAVVFSPTFFPDEETDNVAELFTADNYHVRKLTGNAATVGNFDFHAQYFPYDVLHICSHGGEVDGYEMTEQFRDQDAVIHTVEFDEVVGFTPLPDNPEIYSVHRKVFPRKLDGLPWRSVELAQQNYPDHVIQAMWKCVLESDGRRQPKTHIAMSCAIVCADSIHQGEFNTLASHSSPLIFNNTCWSWSEVSSFFLSCGARGYIGTLWAIENEAAVRAAKTFYEALFSGSILEAFHKSVKSIDGTASKDVYIYWGLHFTTLSPAESFAKSKTEVEKELLRAVSVWERKIKSTKNLEIKRNSLRVLRSILAELTRHFASVQVRNSIEQIKASLPELSQRSVLRGEPEAETGVISKNSLVEFRAKSDMRRKMVKDHDH